MYIVIISIDALVSLIIRSNSGNQTSDAGNGNLKPLSFILMVLKEYNRSIPCFKPGVHETKLTLKVEATLGPSYEKF